MQPASQTPARGSAKRRRLVGSIWSQPLKPRPPPLPTLLPRGNRTQLAERPTMPETPLLHGCRSRKNSADKDGQRIEQNKLPCLACTLETRPLTAQSHRDITYAALCMWKCQTANLQSTHVQPLCHAPAASLVPNVVHRPAVEARSAWPLTHSHTRRELWPSYAAATLNAGRAPSVVHFSQCPSDKRSSPWHYLPEKGGVHARRHALDLYHRTAH